MNYIIHESKACIIKCPSFMENFNELSEIEWTNNHYIIRNNEIYQFDYEFLVDNIETTYHTFDFRNNCFLTIKKTTCGDDTYYKNGVIHRDNDLPAEVGTKWIEWYCNGLIHRSNDLPARINKYGVQQWYKRDKQYRVDDKPTTVLPGVYSMWNKDNKYSRKNGLPNIEFDMGTKCWAIGEIPKGDLEKINVDGDGNPINVELLKSMGVCNVIFKNGDKQYYYDSYYLIECVNGDKIYKNMRYKIHNGSNKPAFIGHDGTKKWYNHGVLHRENDLPAIICGNGDMYWYYEGVLHRDDGPAIIYHNGKKEYYCNGLYITRKK